MQIATGVRSTYQGLCVEGMDEVFGDCRCEVADLASIGLPTRKNRRVFHDTNFSEWKKADFTTYCSGLSIELPAGRVARHRVYETVMADGTTVLVPALAFMRAFLRPCSALLDAAFSPGNIDRLAFISFKADVPVVIAMNGRASARPLVEHRGEHRYLSWLHSSRSARDFAQSVHSSATQGWLDVDLPKGMFKLTYDGLSKDNLLFVTSVSVVTVLVHADDNISGQDEVFYLHRQQHVQTQPGAIHGNARLADDEWLALSAAIKDIPDREMLELVLHRIEHGHWPIARPGKVVEAGEMLREWRWKEKLGILLQCLSAIRAGIFRPSASRLSKLSLKVPSHETVHQRDQTDELTLKVFLDTEFIEKGEDLHLLSLALSSYQGDFYAERNLSTLPGDIQAGSFIDDEVLPQIGHGLGIRGSMCEIAKALVSWVNGLGHHRVHVCYDFNADYALLEDLVAMVPGALAVVLEPTHVGYLHQDPGGDQAARLCWRESERTLGIRRHHALADALALKARFQAHQQGPQLLLW